MDLQIEAKVNNPEEKAYAKANLNYQNENLFSLEYVNSNNIYALKSDEIVTAFLGVENSNLKVLAQKLGIIDTKTIPDEIKHKRFDKLKLLVESQIKENNDKYIGTIQRVLVEGKSKNNQEMLTARTDTNKVVVFEGNKELIGNMVDLKIVSEHMWYLKGEIY